MPPLPGVDEARARMLGAVSRLEVEPVSLREARFSDGAPVEAEDVAYTLRGLLDDKTGSPLLRVVSSVAA